MFGMFWKIVINVLAVFALQFSELDMEHSDPWGFSVLQPVIYSCYFLLLFSCTPSTDIMIPMSCWDFCPPFTTQIQYPNFCHISLQLFTVLHAIGPFPHLPSSSLFHNFSWICCAEDYEAPPLNHVYYCRFIIIPCNLHIYACEYSPPCPNLPQPCHWTLLLIFALH